MHRGADFQRSPLKGRGLIVALVIFSWCGSWKAPRELENPSTLSFQLARTAENGARACLRSFPLLPGGDCSGLTQASTATGRVFRVFTCLVEGYPELCHGWESLSFAPCTPIYQRRPYHVLGSLVDFQSFGNEARAAGTGKIRKATKARRFSLKFLKFRRFPGVVSYLHNRGRMLQFSTWYGRR